MKQIYFSVALLVSGITLGPTLLGSAQQCPCVTKKISCPCVTKDGGVCACAARGEQCNCAVVYAKDGTVPASCPCPKTEFNPTATNPVVEVSYGELFDKVTILEIKAVQLNDEAKRNNVLTELDLLNTAVAQVLQRNQPLESQLLTLKDELSDVNKKLWQVEDALREKESHKSFDAEFIALARSVYKLNGERIRVKSTISTLLHSHIVEEKCYVAS